MKKLLIIFFLGLGVLVHAQNLPVVSGNYTNQSLTQILQDFALQTDYFIYFNSAILDTLDYTGTIKSKAINEALKEVFQKTTLRHFIQDSSIYVANDLRIIDQPQISAVLMQNSGLQKKTQQVEKGLLFSQEYLTSRSGNSIEEIVFEIGNRSDLTPGGTSTLAGYVTDKETGEPLIGALVYTVDPFRASSTDPDGFFSLKLPNGKSTILIQYSGMKNTQRNIVMFSNGRLDIAMDLDVIALQEVTIESMRDANVQDVQMGVERINVAETKNVPLALGERDIIKIATTFAGVQSPGEGAAGFNVRGGKSDQNLVLLNDATIYNASHFLGFFSVFNSDAIENMQIYKSGIPAKFGGRLSSVFDIESKSASKEKFKGMGGISPITSRLTLEVPVIKNKAGLMVSGRTTYSNWLLRNVKSADFSENEVAFKDLLIRYDHDVTEKDKLILNMYLSDDDFRMSSDTLFSFSNFGFINANGSAKWTHTFSNSLDASLSGIYSKYQYKLQYDESAPNAFVQDFDIAEATVKAAVGHYIDDINTINAGIEIKKYDINPGTKTPLGEASLVKPKFINEEYGIESALYLSDEYNVNDRMTLSGGVRYSHFTQIGPGISYQYADNSPKNGDTRIDSTSYSNNEWIKSYSGPEFRVSARYSLDEISSIKGSYGRTRQYLHTLSNSASLSPTDTWRLSGEHLKPQIADQYALGYYRNFSRNTIETSVEVYYKTMQNLIDFKVGSDFLLNNNVETVTLQGPGKSYGIELSLKKSGRLNGWINYSYARTFIQLDSEFPEERINKGTYYPSSYDMPHTINLVANYKITKRFSASYNLVYNTGKPVTYPVATYGFKGFEAVNYSQRNAFRIPDYFRMDLGLSLEAGHKIKKLAHSYFTFSIYNLLGRDNPYSVFFDLYDGNVQGYKLVVFGKAIPTLSYNFEF